MAAPDVTITRSERETARAGERLSSTLGPGAFVLLHGDLGAGKTAFVRGMAVGLGADADDVSSPTFVLVQHYRGRVPLTHIDLYRLEHAAEIEELGVEEMVDGGVVAIEWAERLPRPIPGAVSVSIEDLGGDERRITIYSER